MQKFGKTENKMGRCCRFKKPNVPHKVLFYFETETANEGHWIFRSNLWRERAMYCPPPPHTSWRQRRVKLWDSIKSSHVFRTYIGQSNPESPRTAERWILICHDQRRVNFWDVTISEEPNSEISRTAESRIFKWFMWGSSHLGYTIL